MSKAFYGLKPHRGAVISSSKSIRCGAAFTLTKSYGAVRVAVRVLVSKNPTVRYGAVIGTTLNTIDHKTSCCNVTAKCIHALTCYVASKTRFITSYHKDESFGKA